MSSPERVLYDCHRPAFAPHFCAPALEVRRRRVPHAVQGDRHERHTASRVARTHSIHSGKSHIERAGERFRENRPLSKPPTPRLSRPDRPRHPRPLVPYQGPVPGLSHPYQPTRRTGYPLAPVSVGRSQGTCACSASVRKGGPRVGLAPPETLPQARRGALRCSWSI